MGKRRRNSSTSSSESNEETRRLRKKLRKIKERYKNLKMGRHSYHRTESSEGSGSDLETCTRARATLAREEQCRSSRQSSIEPGEGSRVFLSQQEDALEEAEPLNEEILRILGRDTASQELTGEIIHRDLAFRWSNILRSGLDDSVRTELVRKYPPIKNCVLMAALKLNLEVKAAVNEYTLKRDERLANIQAQVGAGLAALGTMNETGVDGWLFGENLGDRVKAAWAIERSGQDLRNSSIKPSSKRKKKTRAPLNYRGPSRHPLREPPGRAEIQPQPSSAGVLPGSSAFIEKQNTREDKERRPTVNVAIRVA
ncbi:hypothetical protein NQ314_012939 [Rhamnusium bicolor]|uniref:Uncharacterized protein n=1 Tax=Rhamnusium bicolor TaxID=1586634 RepID=A0AAV8X8P3_9CUCU|nr:hypothetical protein NQ314_012939 [Rhamnusium bicolor]